MEGSQARYVITLVHGTFARGAPWTQAGSSLWKALEERFGDAAKIQRFDWSARNTHESRLKAGQELAHFLNARAKENPAARNVVITHSHGGNVAIYACKHAAPGSISDIVFLATPFIRCRDRARISLFTYAGLLILSALLGFALTNLLLPVIWLVDTVSPYLPSRDIAFQVVSWAALLPMTGLVYWALLAYLRRTARRRVESLAWPAAAHVNTLCVYYRWDEAKGYLSALNWGTTGVSRLIWQLIGITIVAYLAYIGATEYTKAYHPDIYQSIYFSTPRKWWGEGPVITRGSWYEFIASSLMIGILMAVLAAFALPLLRGHPLGYGWERPSSTMIIDVDVISEPVGFLAASSESFAIDISDAKREGLAHSYVYEDARILAKIVDWLVRRQAATA